MLIIKSVDRWNRRACAEIISELQILFWNDPKGYAYCRFYGGIHRIFVDIMPRMENDNYADKYTEVK